MVVVLGSMNKNDCKWIRFDLGLDGPLVQKVNINKRISLNPLFETTHGQKFWHLYIKLSIVLQLYFSHILNFFSEADVLAIPEFMTRNGNLYILFFMIFDIHKFLILFHPFFMLFRFSLFFFLFFSFLTSYSLNKHVNIKT